MNALGLSLGAVRRRFDPDWTKSRFIVVGGVNTLFGLSVFPLLMWAFWPYHQFYMVLLLASFILSTAFSFVTNKFLTFRTKGRYLSEIGKFTSFYLGGFLLNLAVLPLCVEIFHLPAVPTQVAYSLLGTILAYFWHSHITFSNTNAAGSK